MRTSNSSILASILLFINQSDPIGARPQASRNPSTKTIESKVGCTDIHAADLLPPEPACEKELFARRGRPFMFPARSGIAFGVSYGADKPSMLYLWADNQTDETVRVYVCCNLTLFDHIDIFDSEGHRVLSKADKAEQKAGSEGTTRACSCSFSVPVPPHTIQLFDFADISVGYTLQPGRYTISERNPPAPYNLSPDENEAGAHAPPGLAISIP